MKCRICKQKLEDFEIDDCEICTDCQWEKDMEYKIEELVQDDQ